MAHSDDFRRPFDDVADQSLGAVLCTATVAERNRLRTENDNLRAEHRKLAANIDKPSERTGLLDSAAVTMVTFALVGLLFVAAPFVGKWVGDVYDHFLPAAADYFGSGAESSLGIIIGGTCILSAVALLAIICLLWRRMVKR